VSAHEQIESGIAEILREPSRNFETHPLTQVEILAVIEILTREAVVPDINPDLEQYYLHCIKFLKSKLLYN